jgi:hypothetical protein
MPRKNVNSKRGGLPKRRHSHYFLDKKTFKEIVNKDHPSGNLSTHRGSIILTDRNRITYIWEADDNYKVWNIICVSLDTLINEGWETVLRYDTCHGPLHIHVRRSIEDDISAVTPFPVQVSGTKGELLHFAIDNIKNKYVRFRETFIRRSKNYLKEHDIML